MNDLQEELVELKAKELALQHIKIIENGNKDRY